MESHHTQVRATDAPSAPRLVMHELGQPLREYGQVAAMRLRAALSDALRRATARLFELGTQALTDTERDSWVDAAELTRLRRDSLADAFAMHFEQRYVRACNRVDSPLSSSRIDFDPSRLRVVEHVMLDDALDPGMLAEAIQNTSWLSLNHLSACFARLLNGRETRPVDFPLAPGLIEAALTEALLGQPWRHDAKRMVMRVLRAEFAQAVGQLYRDLLALGSPSDTALAPVAGEAAEWSPPELPETPEPVRHAAAPVGDDASAPAGAGESEPASDIGLASVASRDDRAASSAGAVRTAPTRRSSETTVAEQAKPAPAPVVTPAPAPAVKPAPTTDEAVSPQAVATPTSTAIPQPREENPAASAAPGGLDKKTMQAALAELACGLCLEFSVPEGGKRELKLAWISPHRSLFVLTNRQGERALCLGAEDMSRALLEGRARVLPPSLSETVAAGPVFRSPARKSA